MNKFFMLVFLGIATCPKITLSMALEPNFIEEWAKKKIIPLAPRPAAAQQIIAQPDTKQKLNSNNYKDILENQFSDALKNLFKTLKEKNIRPNQIQSCKVECYPKHREDVKKIIKKQNPVIQKLLFTETANELPQGCYVRIEALVTIRHKAAL